MLILGHAAIRSCLSAAGDPEQQLLSVLALRECSPGGMALRRNSSVAGIKSSVIIIWVSSQWVSSRIICKLGGLVRCCIAVKLLSIAIAAAAVAEHWVGELAQLEGRDPAAGC